MTTPAERLKYTLIRFGYHRKQGKVAARTGIHPVRFSRILSGAPMYAHEIIALVEYFPGLSYQWLLEGQEQTDYIDQASDRLAAHIDNMSIDERLGFVEGLRDQK